MKLHKHGMTTSGIEVQAISPQGIWLYIKEREYLLPYKVYPWFKQAKVSEIYNVRLLRGVHLYWPDLDVDLELESLERPEQYPLTYQ